MGAGGGALVGGIIGTVCGGPIRLVIGVAVGAGTVGGIATVGADAAKKKRDRMNEMIEYEGLSSVDKSNICAKGKHAGIMEVCNMKKCWNDICHLCWSGE